MQHRKLRTFQISLLALAVAVCLFILFRPQRHDDPNKFNWHKLPQDGFAENDTKGTVPGDVENGVRGLKQFNRVIQTYRSRHGGVYPQSNKDIMADCKNVPSAYGVGSVTELLHQHMNPDNKFGDLTYMKPGNIMPYSPIGIRPDGNPVGGEKPSGTRDAIAMTSLYVHQNIRIYGEGKSTENPVGWYLVLWDDGSVEKVAYDKILYCISGSGTRRFAFPHQAGLPQKDVLTYDQYYQRLGWKAGPRGVKGGDVFSDKTYNPPSGG